MTVYINIFMQFNLPARHTRPWQSLWADFSLLHEPPGVLITSLKGRLVPTAITPCLLAEKRARKQLKTDLLVSVLL